MADVVEDEPDPQALLTALTTEHFTLQTARTAMVSDANGRTNQFLNSVSAALVALAFVAQVSQVGATFYAFALTVLPVMVFLGVVAVVRAAQIGVEDLLYGRAISRIRAYYVEVAASRAELLLLAQAGEAGERADALLTDLIQRESRLQPLIATWGTLAVVTAVLAGATAAIAVSAAGAALAADVIVGLAVAAVALAMLLRFGIRMFTTAHVLGGTPVRHGP